MQPRDPQPAWVCRPCGLRYGARQPFPILSVHEGECGVCHRLTAVAEPRDFGYLKPEWEKR